MTPLRLRSITARLLLPAFCVAGAAALAGIAFSAPLQPQDSSPPQTREYFTAQVKDLSGARYLPEVKKALSRAEHSIHLAMFLLEFDPRNVRSPVTQLVAELVSAKERGVKVILRSFPQSGKRRPYRVPGAGRADTGLFLPHPPAGVGGRRAG